MADDINPKRMAEVVDLMVTKLTYSPYELTDEHMLALIQHPTLPHFTPLRRAHFKTWLAEHDRRVKAEGWDEGTDFFMENIHGDTVDVTEYNPYREEAS